MYRYIVTTIMPNGNSYEYTNHFWAFKHPEPTKEELETILGKYGIIVFMQKLYD